MFKRKNKSKEKNTKNILLHSYIFFPKKSLLFEVRLKIMKTSKSAMNLLMLCEAQFLSAIKKI